MGGSPSFSTPTIEPEPAPDRFDWLDPWLVTGGSSLRDLAVALVDAFERYEQAHYPRRRARKEGPGVNDRARLHEQLGVIAANLAYAVLYPRKGDRLAVNLAHGSTGRTRYQNPAFGKSTTDVLEKLSGMGVVDLRKGGPRRGRVRGVSSSIAPTSAFAEMVADYEVSPADFGRDEREEVIILSRNERRGTGFEEDGLVLRRERVHYRDTSETRRMREEVQGINAFLEGANIAIVVDADVPAIDTRRRRLRRHFTLLPDDTGQRFDRGGRLFGGFWQGMKRSHRQHMRIDGEPVAVLDYSSMFTRLAYAEAGAEPPEGDLYEIEGLRGYRADVKTLTNCLWFDRRTRREWPRDILEAAAAGSAGVREVPGPPYPLGSLPNEIASVSAVRKFIAAHHLQVKHLLGKGIGHRLMFQESEILVRVLSRLAGLGVAGLGLHDGLMVQRSKAVLAREVMVGVGEELVGVMLPVDTQDLSNTFPPPIYHLGDP